jgi:uncharacterized protein
MRLILTTLFLLLPATTRAQFGHNSANAISVNGDAEVQVAPDLVTISVGAEGRHAQLAAARAANDASIRAIMAAAALHGVARADLQSDFVEVQPIYARAEDASPAHYRVHKAITVTLRDVSRFDRLLTALINAGANQVYGVEFQTSELRKHRDAARDAAVKAALEKGAALAAAAGLKVGKPTSISSNNWFSGSRYGRWRSHSYGNEFAAQNVMVSGNTASASTGLFSPGRISIRTDVTLTLPLEP